MAAESMSTLEHLSAILKKVVDDLYTESNNATIRVVSLSTAADYPQFKFKINITHEGSDDVNLFAKVTELGHNKWDDIILKPFVKERLFYTELMKVYRQLEERSGVSGDDRLKVAAFHAAEAEHRREVLLLEDLTSRGFIRANRTQSVTWPYAVAAITELAKLHALSIAFRRDNPTEFDKFTTQVPGGVFENNEETVQLLEGFKNLVLEVVRPENKKVLKAFFKRQPFVASYNNALKPVHCKVILHAHYWPNNMMHKVLDEGTVEVVPLDFQSIQVGSPVTDLLHFIFTATDAPFRSKHCEALIEHYTSQLKEALARLGLDIQQEFPSEAMDNEIGEKLTFGLLAAVAYIPVLALDDREDEFQEPADEQGLRAAEMLSTRINQVVDELVDSGILNEETASRKPCGMCLVC